jgi:HrpA-like RNA helicase
MSPPIVEHEGANLPVHLEKRAILNAIRENKVTVIVGETGSGKTTQVPQFLLDNGFRSIAITQPRRISAISLAQRISEERRSKLGSTVGYSVRFDEMTSNRTQIKFVTDGMLLRELLLDATLSRYDVVILDEVHERSVRTDILIGTYSPEYLSAGVLFVVVLEINVLEN